MTAIELKSLDDLVFQDRNKAYGAYQLRKNQNRNFAIAMIVVFGSIGLAWGVQTLLSFFKEEIPQEVFHPGPDETGPVNDWKEPSLPEPKSSGGFQRAATTSTASVTIVDSVASTTSPAYDPEAFASGIENETGAISGTENTGNGDGNNGNGQPGILGNEEEPEPELTPIVEGASFPGGDVALEAFIKTKFDFPKHEIEDAVSGVLVMYFEIDEFGKTKNIKVIKSFPNAEKFEKEAIRVLGTMPDWSPKKINGKPVMTRRELKINCKL